MTADPHALLSDSSKSTLASPGGRVLGFGPGPGLAQCIAWNGIGSLFSCYRPGVACLTVFTTGAPGAAPVALARTACAWHPNHAAAAYAGRGLRIAEDRYALPAGLVCRLILRLDPRQRRAREYLLRFHGQVEQWPFFDYPALLAGTADNRPAPLVRCTIDPPAGCLALVQPHPHPGLPPDAGGAPPRTVQHVSASLPFASYGFGLSEADLHALQQDHGALASLRMRLGQVGGRYGPGAREGDRAIEFAHCHPLYYFTLRVVLEPGRDERVVVASTFAVEAASRDAALQHPPSDAQPTRLVSQAQRTLQSSVPTGAQAARAIAANRRAWQRYLAREVPQLDCSDPALTKYWYYVWHILRANRCAPGAHIKHAWTAPSKYMYWGPWVWDGYFHVLGEMWLADARIAFDSIRAVLDMQFPNGFIPVCSGADYRMCFHDSVQGYTPPAGYGGYASYVPGELAEYREGQHPFEARLLTERGSTGPLPNNAALKSRAPLDFTHNEKTQTPLITLAAADLLRLRGAELPGGRQTAARELLGPLWAFEQWLWRRRTDGAGRFILWHGDESGWDDATRHYPVPCRPYDVQVHCLLHREALREVMLAAGQPTHLAALDRRIAKTRRALDTYWHAGDKWHYDLAGDGPSRGRAALGPDPAPPEQARAEHCSAPTATGPSGGAYRNQIAASSLFGLLADSRAQIVDSALFALGHPRVFASAFPIPTLAVCDPDYKPHGWGWNGPVWLQVNYFAITGLLRAARSGRRDALEAAWRLWEQTRALVIRDAAPHSYELYDPATGTGMGCPDYAWQAMLLHLLVHWFAGVPVGVQPSGGQPPDSRPSSDVGKPPPTELSPCLPPGLPRLRLANLPGAAREIELRREHSELRIAVTLPRAGRIALRDGGLGSCTGVRLADGTPLERGADGAWQLPDGRPRRTWVIIAACR